MVVISRAARLVVLAALLWSAGCFVAAVNWHTSWRGFASSGEGASPTALEAQDRWQHWVDMTLLGVLVTVAGLAVVVWQVLRAAQQVQLDRAPTEAERQELRGR